MDSSGRLLLHFIHRDFIVVLDQCISWTVSGQEFVFSYVPESDRTYNLRIVDGKEGVQPWVILFLELSTLS